MQKSNVGAWIFASVLLVVLAAFGIVYYNNYQADQHRKEEAAQQKKDEEDARTDAAFNDTLRTTCLTAADKDYEKYVEINATSSEETPDGTVYRAPQVVWDTAADRRDTAKDDCYRQYPN